MQNAKEAIQARVFIKVLKMHRYRLFILKELDLYQINWTSSFINAFMSTEPQQYQ